METRRANGRTVLWEGDPAARIDALVRAKTSEGILGCRIAIARHLNGFAWGACAAGEPDLRRAGTEADLARAQLAGIIAAEELLQNEILVRANEKLQIMNLPGMPKRPLHKFVGLL